MQRDRQHQRGASGSQSLSQRLSIGVAGGLLLTAALLGIGCSSASMPSTSSMIQSVGTGGSDGGGAAAGGSGGAAEAVTLGICADLPPPVPVEGAVNTYIGAIFGDCDVVQLLLPLDEQSGQAFFNDLVQWSFGFLGCEGVPPVTTFGPADTGKPTTLTQLDVDTIIDHYAATLKVGLKMSDAQDQAARQALAKLGASAVTSPLDGHALSLCSDAGAGGSGGGAGTGGAGGASGGAAAGGSGTAGGGGF